MAEIKDIIKLLDKGNLEGAFDLVDDMESKKDAAALLSDYAAMIAKQYNLLDIVEKLLIKAIELDPKCVGAHFNLGVLYTEPELLIEDGGKVKDAEKHYLKAVELEPENIKVRYNLGLLYAYTRRSEDAREQYLKVLELDSKNSDKYDVLDGLIRQAEL